MGIELRGAARYLPGVALGRPGLVDRNGGRDRPGISARRSGSSRRNALHGHAETRVDASSVGQRVRQGQYLFKVAVAWLAVVALCAIGSIVARDTSFSGPAGIVLREFGFVALLMALRPFLLGFIRAGKPARTR